MFGSVFQSSMRRAVVAVNATTISPQIVVRRGKSSVAPLSKRFPRDTLTINHPNTMLDFDSSISSSASVWQEQQLSTAWFLHPTTDGLIPPPAAATKNNNNNRPTKTVITSLQELLLKVPGTVKERKDKNIAPGSPYDPVIQLFRQTQLSPEEWQRYAFWDASKPYTRNLISTDHETFTVLLLCWNPQQESPIHDHPCDGCWLQVLRGKIQECRYHSQDLHCLSDETFEEGQIAYITDNMGYHKIGNPTHATPAATLHLYAPPIQECRTWRLEETSQQIICQDAVSTHYSEYGFRIKT